MTLLNLDLKSTIIDTYYIWFSSRTMCDFHDLVSLNNVKSGFWVVALLPQRLKSTLFEIFFSLRWLLGAAQFKKISNKVDFSL